MDGWTLRPALPSDRDFLYELSEATMREYVEAVWGWDDRVQSAMFDDRFRPEAWLVVQVGGRDVGVLVVEERDQELYVARIEISPEWQGRGIGSAVIRSLMDEAAASGKELRLDVLHANGRARRLYERLGFDALAESKTRTSMRWTANATPSP
jgi:ribosomal protein S18 acetylase RimI-like enzyme